MQFKAKSILTLGYLLALCSGCSSHRMVRFSFVIPTGVKEADYRVETDEARKLSSSDHFELVVHNGKILVPKGFLVDMKQQAYFEVTEVKDDTGIVLSTGDNPPKGQVGVRGFTVRWGQDELDKTGNLNNWYFQISDKVLHQ